MNYSRKNTISQQKNDGQSYSLGITQSSGLDRLSGYPDKRCAEFNVEAGKFPIKSVEGGGKLTFFPAGAIIFS